MNGTDDRPCILFATVAAGGSHVSTAQAMKEAIETHYPGRYRLEISEIMVEYGFRDLDRRHKALWRLALQHPWSIWLVQGVIDALPQISVPVQKLMLRSFSRRAARRLSRPPRPDLVIVNHGPLTLGLTQAQRKFGLQVPVVTFETSTRNANALWAAPDTERFITASRASQHRLHRLGVPMDRIDVVGYPVRQAFIHAPSKAVARKAIGLEEASTCLVSLGGEGLGAEPEQLIKALKRHDEGMQIVVIAGRNRELRERLERLAAGMRRVHVRGFVDDMALYVAASDIVVGKSGPATVYETLAVGRPLLSPQKFGPSESRLLRVLERLGVGGYFPDVERLSAEATRYLGCPAALQRVHRISRAFDFAGMAERLARYITHYAKHGEPDPDAVGRGLRFFAVRLEQARPGQARSVPTGLISRRDSRDTWTG
ncbi:MAG: glycosyltransferase [Spirochaetales bacterium]|nr:glycosyltransferase [Spirochaetales bacterium]